MDSLLKFLNKISYKFNRGYPDLSNPEDVKIIYEHLESLGIDLDEKVNTTTHWEERIEQRGKIEDIKNFPKSSITEYPPEEVKPLLISYIENTLSQRLSKLENTNNDFPPQNHVIYKILKPILKVDDKKYPLLMQVKSFTNGVEKTYYGTFYYAHIKDNALITLEVAEKDEDIDLELKIKKHNETNDIKNSPLKFLSFANFEDIIDINELMGNKKEIESEFVSSGDLPYDMKTDYRKGGNFNHKTYGKGTVVTTSSGNSGVGDALGKLDWVEVQFDQDLNKPRLSQGKLITTRKIPNVYTKVSSIVK